jgi:hypothetical protein
VLKFKNTALLNRDIRPSMCFDDETVTNLPLGDESVTKA